MKKIDYCKKYGVTEAKLETILAMSKKFDQSLSNEQENISPRIFTGNRKEHKKKLSKVIKKLSGKPSPWNKDDLKISPWIYKK
ncbi:hypothetical protein D3C73_745560 [compost metagenome]